MRERLWFSLAFRHADVSDVDNLAAAGESAELLLANVIRNMEEKMDDITPGDVEESGDCVQSGNDNPTQKRSALISTQS